MERRLLSERPLRSDGVVALMTRITHNALRIHLHFERPLRDEWRRLLLDNLERLSVDEVLHSLLLMAQGEAEVEGEGVDWALMARLSVHQLRAHNLGQLSADQLNTLLHIMTQIEAPYPRSLSLLLDLEGIVSERLCASPPAIGVEHVQRMEQCLDRLELSKARLLKAKQYFIDTHRHSLAPHWSKFYTRNNEEEAGDDCSTEARVDNDFDSDHPAIDEW